MAHFAPMSLGVSSDTEWGLRSVAIYTWTLMGQNLERLSLLSRDLLSLQRPGVHTPTMGIIQGIFSPVVCPR